MQAKITVMILTYNRAEMLSRVVDSVLAQSFQEYELLLINNGSTDNTDTICNAYAEKNNSVRVYTLPVNQGISAARNFALDQVRTEFCIFIDDDDFIEPDMLAHLYGMVQDFQADIAITGCVDEYPDGRIVPKYQYDERYILNREEGVSEFLKREKFHTSPGTKLFRYRLFDGIRFPKGVLIDDIHTIYKLFVAARRTVVQGIPDYHYCKHVGNATGFLSGSLLRPEVLEDYLNMQEERIAYITEKLPSLTEQAVYAKYSYLISMVERIEKGEAERCEAYLIRMKNTLRENADRFLQMKWVTERERRLMAQYILH